MKTPDETKFCMEIADMVRTKVNELEPDNKFVILNMLDNFLNQIRSDVSEEWTYCAHCFRFVKIAERTVELVDGYEVTRCGNCGEMHKRFKIFY